MEKKEKKFEEKMSELEVLVKSLENGDIALDDAIKSFTEAMNLAKYKKFYRSNESCKRL